MCDQSGRNGESGQRVCGQSGQIDWPRLQRGRMARSAGVGEGGYACGRAGHAGVGPEGGGLTEVLVHKAQGGVGRGRVEGGDAGGDGGRVGGGQGKERRRDPGLPRRAWGAGWARDKGMGGGGGGEGDAFKVAPRPCGATAPLRRLPRHSRLPGYLPLAASILHRPAGPDEVGPPRYSSAGETPPRLHPARSCLAVPPTAAGRALAPRSTNVTPTPSSTPRARSHVTSPARAHAAVRAEAGGHREVVGEVRAGHDAEAGDEGGARHEGVPLPVQGDPRHCAAARCSGAGGWGTAALRRAGLYCCSYVNGWGRGGRGGRGCELCRRAPQRRRGPGRAGEAVSIAGEGEGGLG